MTLEPGTVKTYDKDGWQAGDTDEELREKLIVPNYNGVTIQIHKHGNMHSADVTPDQNGVTFRMYTYDETTEAWRHMDSQKTEGNGIATFTVAAGYEYAISEESVPSGYAGLEGVWTSDGIEIKDTATVDEGGANPQTLYILDTKDLLAGQTYTYNAYNIPLVDLEVQKKDAGGNTTLVPRADISVYEVPAGTKTELTEEEVDDLKVPTNLVGTGNTSKTGEGYSYKDDITVVPGKTYLVVEDKVTGTSGYETMILDDKRVVWYKVITIPEGTTKKQTVTLENVLGTADVKIDKKSASQTSSASLFEQGSEITYTLTPQVENSYALDGFTLTDTGLTAYHGAGSTPAELDFDTYLKDQYTISQVRLGQASHETGNYKAADGHPEAGVISAKVTFIDFEGGEHATEPVTVSTGEQVVMAPATEGVKYAQVKVEYYSDGLKQLTGYQLGQNFKPGTVQVTAELDQQQGGEDRQSVDRVVNTAEAEIAYTPWSSTGEKEAQVTKKAQDTAANSFGQQEVPMVTVTKAADDETVNLNNGTVNYTLTLENISENGEAMTNPILIDLLPEGVIVDPDATYFEITGDNPSNLSVNQDTVVPVAETNAIVLNFSGDLKAGDSLQVVIHATVTNAAASYGTNLPNYVFATSDEPGIESDENPNAASFKDSNDAWAGELTHVATSLQVDGGKASALKDALGSEGPGAVGNYGFIGALADIRWFSSSAMTLVKENKGDRDSSYSSSRLAQATNGGTIDYRLTMNNTSSTDNRLNLTVMDLLPQEGDLVSGGTERYSVWPAYLTGDITVTLGENTLTSNQYKIYYYTGEIPAANSQDYSSFFGAVQEAQDGCPEGWIETRPADTAIKAFIVAVDEEQILKTTESLVVEYQTNVTDKEGNKYTEEEMEKISYLNAVNNFQCYYDSYPTTGSAEEATPADQPLESNSVSATIVPNPVKVGGHVWIDADGNGRKDGKTIEDYSRYKIVQDMLDKIEIRLYTYRNKKPGINTTAYGEALQYNQKDDENWRNDANYVFNDLDAGFMTVDEGQAYDNGELQVQHLKGDEPRTYIISATLPDTIIGKFGLTQMLGSKKSQEPGSIPDKEQNDSNFTYYEDTQRNLSERFYLWATDITQEGNWDNTKDVGLVLYRDLEITKQSELPAADPVDGAVFKIYGPYEDGKGSTAQLTDDDLVGIYETEDGKISVPNLNWFQEYVIVEETAAPGYELDGAEATGSKNIEKLGEGKWLLKVPDTESMVKTENVTITNVRETEVELEATKTLKGKELLAGQFQFELLADDGMTVLQKEVSNDAEGKVTFASVTVQGVGTHTFYIRETIPEEAIENEDTLKGITYDDAIYQVEVTTGWNEAKQQLEVTGIQYFADNALTPNQDGAAFENTYDASGSWTPEGTKTLTGRDMKAGETYTFTVKEGEETVGTGTVTGPATADTPADITFTPIQYTLEDVSVHTYTITEDKGGTTANGVEFTDTSFTITVDVEDAGDGTLTATPTYPEGGVAFVNDYKPTPTSYAPAVEKTLTGHRLPDGEGKDFTFTLTPDKDNPDGATLPQETTLTIPISGKTSDAAVTATKAFGNITFSKAGTYKFTIKETAGTESYYSYDTAEWTLTVVVNDDGLGRLSTTTVSYKSNVEGTAANNGAAKFSNEYHPNPTTAKLTVSKTVEGQELPDDQTYKTFTFTMSMSEDTVPGVTMPENKTATVTVTETGEAQKADFDEITFTKAGTYVFRITEDTENLPEGYDKDRVPARRARVVVEDDNGSLKVDSITYYLTNPNDSDDTQNASDFTNYYDTADTGFAPKVNKTLTGDTPPGEKKFTFKLKADENNPEGATLPDPAQTTVTYEKRIGDAEAGFGEITFEKAGTFKFIITEVPGQADDGYTYDEAQWTLTVKVEDEGGKLKVENYSYAKDGETVTGAEAAAFENSYEVKPTDYTPGVTKAMTGADRQKAQTYEFILTPGENNPEGGATITGAEASITVPKDTAVNTEVSPTDDGFGKITFEKAGTYTFTIQEKIPEEAEANGNKLNGVTYDNSKWTLTVVVEDEGSQLKVTSHTYAKTGGSSNNDAAKFVNNYEVAPTEFTPDVRKTVTGEIRPAEETFTFTLTADKDNPEGGAKCTDRQAAVTVPAGGTKEGSLVEPKMDPFGAITFTETGTYTFTITEINVGEQGYTYDDPWTLTVVVRDEKGQLVVDKAQTKYERTGETDRTDYALFTNHYKVAPIGYAPQVKKTVEGNVPDGRDADFRFELKLTKADPTDGLKLNGENGVVMTNTDVLETEVTGEATGTFDKITFTRAGTYTFQITEVKGDTAGYSYDGHIWILEVKVKDEGGRLVIESKTYTQTEADKPTGFTSESQAEFTNTYDPDKITYTPQIRKEITGDQRSEEQVFDFTLTPDDKNPGGASLAAPDMDKARVTGEDIARFSTITFTEAGTYHFTIGEETGTEPGYTYDDSEWNLEIEVKDQGGCLMVAKHTYTRTDAEGKEVTSDEEATFTNDYQVKSTGYVPTVTKAVTGDVPEGNDAQFRFALTAREDNPKGAVLPKDTEVTIEGRGEANFGEIKFEQAGTYRFDIAEINDKLTGYQYDDSIWTLTVVVKDTDSILGVESATYTRQDAATSDVAAFENSYQPDEAAYAPQVTKHLSGDKTPSNATFTFTMQAHADNPEGAAVEGTSASVAGAGQTTFAPITFTKAGTYRFDIRETDGGENGYTYDKEPWTLTIVVEDVDGQLTVVSHTYTRGTDNNGTEAVFTNSYKIEDSVPFTPEVKKTVTGEKRPTGTQTFDFTLTPPAGDGFTIANRDTKATVSVTDNDPAGTTTDPFGAITFTKAGTYEFQIAEEKGSANGYTYDTDPWTLTVAVEDQDGQLVVTSHTYTRDGDRDSEAYASFTNTYKVEPAEFTPEVKKTMTGGARPGEVAFTFELSAKKDESDPVEGAVMPEDTTAAITLTPEDTEGTGSAAGQDGFGAIRFVHAGTYEFEITETDDGQAGYGYDGSTWNLKVTVEDIGGKLQVAKDGVQYVKADGTGANADAAAFVNSYSTTKATYDPRVTKALTGDPTPVDKTFTFTLVRNEAAEEAGTPADGAVTGNSQTTITGAGSGSFGDISFDKAGTYHFTIAEAPGSEAGYTYDPLTWDLEVVVEDRASYLTIVSHTYTQIDADGKEIAASDEQATFTNSYEVVPAGYTPAVTKAVTGDVPEGKDASFRFALAAREDNPEGAVLPKKTEAAIKGSGEAVFGEIQFGQAGTYRFDITEINDKLPGYQYDGSVWTLTVVVKDTGHILGVESATYTRQDGTTADAAAFENHYQPDEAAYAPKVTKHISGDKTPSNATFTFTMQALADNPEGAAVEGTFASVAGAGQTAFAPVTFDRAGTYQFEICEEGGHEDGYLYDAHIWRLTVEVADEDGALHIADVKYEKLGTFEQNGDAAAFTNVYHKSGMPGGDKETGGGVRTGDLSDMPRTLTGLGVSMLLILFLLHRRRRGQAK